MKTLAFILIAFQVSLAFAGTIENCVQQAGLEGDNGVIAVACKGVLSNYSLNCVIKLAPATTDVESRKGIVKACSHIVNYEGLNCAGQFAQAPRANIAKSVYECAQWALQDEKYF